MPQHREAIPYSRFSSKPQEKGDSLRRQREAFERVCQRHKLTPSERWVFVDEGRSGFHAVHREKGDLGRFLALVKSGEIKAGSVMVIEAWDRFGRERPDRATKVLSEIVSAGIAIAVDSPDMLVTEEDFGSWKWQIIQTMISLAYQESKRKSDMLRASWQGRRESGKPATSVCPSWLEPDGDGFKPVPWKAEIVRRIFRLSLEGHGAGEIRNLLVKENVPPIGKKGWADVLGILRNPAVMGTYQPMERVGRNERRPAGPPKANYYPAVVDETTFYAVQAALDSRRLSQRGRKGKAVTNLFTELLYHVEDGLKMYVKRESSGRAVLMRRTPGPNRSWPYQEVEYNLLRWLGELKLVGTVVSGAVETLEAELADTENRIQAVKKRLEKDSDLESLLDVLTGLEKKRKRLRDDLDKEKARQPENVTLEHTHEILKALETAKGEELVSLRTRLKANIHRLVSRVDCWWGERDGAKAVVLTAHLSNGEKREIVFTATKKRRVSYNHVSDKTGTTEVWRLRA